jgi:AraC-like DNA-binding protein
MTYEAELVFLQNVMEKLRISMRTLDKSQISDRTIYSEFRQMLGDGSAYERLLQDYLRTLRHRTIYRMRDPYEFCYLFFLLPEVGRETAVFIGPYLDREVTHEGLLELGERMGLSPQRLRLFEQEIALIPVVREDSVLYAVLESFADRIWGGSEQYTMTDIKRELSDLDRIREKPVNADPEETLWRMKMHEQRYASENEMMYAVTHGLTHKVETMFSHFNQLLLDKRMADPVRDMKNYAIVMNTLMRKAAEQGGVHPIYLDETSSDFSRRIEQLGSVETVIALMTKIGPSYCRLVRKYALVNYSQLVQSVIACIDADLTADLSLRSLAKRFNVSASYLSSQFAKETGHTITDYVNKARMELAIRLLDGTRLQIQTIAQHCGILDVNYFSKLFKKYIGMSPVEWRRTARLHKPI